MKTRSDFVTNSSSSSFVIAFKTLSLFDEETSKKYPFLDDLMHEIIMGDSGYYETEEGEIIENDDSLREFIADSFGYKQTFSEVCKEDEYAKEIYKLCKQKLKKGYKILFKNVAYNDLREKLFKKMESDDFIILRED